MKPARDGRRYARIILLNAAQQVLLIRFVVERHPELFIFWAPGGRVEEGETDFDAARHELAEELALDIALTGPVHTVPSTFEHQGKPVNNIDVFFLGRHETLGVALR
jgi:8-oxo-dGTP pyrophosphatase MutT (NUDIX family)